MNNFWENFLTVTKMVCTISGTILTVVAVVEKGIDSLWD